MSNVLLVCYSYVETVEPCSCPANPLTYESCDFFVLRNIISYVESPAFGRLFQAESSQNFSKLI